MIAHDSLESGPPLREKIQIGMGLPCGVVIWRLPSPSVSVLHRSSAGRKLDKSASRARRVGGILYVHRGIHLASSMLRCSTRPRIPATRVFRGTRSASVLSASSRGVELAWLVTFRIEFPGRGSVTRVLE